MTMQFKRVPPNVLDLSTGVMYDPSGEIAITADSEEAGTPYQEEVMQLIKDGTPIEQVMKAVDSHPDIQDKESLKQFAQSQVTK